jgi:hypothetical protein
MRLSLINATKFEKGERKLKNTVAEKHIT